MAQFLGHCQTSYSTSKVQTGKIKLEPSLPLKTTAINRKQCATCTPPQ